jgi:hypothetical protein
MPLVSPNWLEPRKPMLRAISVGNVSWMAAAGLAYALWPEVAAHHGAAERLAFAAELAMAPAIVIVLIVLSCMRLFDTARAEDPFAGAETREWKINQRVLQNTVEQAMIFLPALFALAVRIDDRRLELLPIAVALWCAGRLLFWFGYRRSIVWRAPGFDWTLNTTLSVIALFVISFF